MSRVATVLVEAAGRRRRGRGGRSRGEWTRCATGHRWLAIRLGLGRCRRVTLPEVASTGDAGGSPAAGFTVPSLGVSSPGGGRGRWRRSKTPTPWRPTSPGAVRLVTARRGRPRAGRSPRRCPARRRGCASPLQSRSHARCSRLVVAAPRPRRQHARGASLEPFPQLVRCGKAQVADLVQARDGRPRGPTAWRPGARIASTLPSAVLAAPVARPTSTARAASMASDGVGLRLCPASSSSAVDLDRLDADSQMASKTRRRRRRCPRRRSGRSFRTRPAARQRESPSGSPDAATPRTPRSGRAPPPHGFPDACRLRPVIERVISRMAVPSLSCSRLWGGTLPRRYMSAAVPPPQPGHPSGSGRATFNFPRPADPAPDGPG